ncbi:hypothetical protein DAEQUDRAFT_473468 [Daedalea quercina L-15889]|uniref:Uncharacterized protein n=1 Tax=Daedalea quercina L-15889 TaxID=1314783 RepID=A0A165MZH2_9APHY|nr:hypothetical protein DAEQUDRAFT_473468 [Daedalea quercina L-15889]
MQLLPPDSLGTIGGCCETPCSPRQTPRSRNTAQRTVAPWGRSSSPRRYYHEQISATLRVRTLIIVVNSIPGPDVTPLQYRFFVPVARARDPTIALVALGFALGWGHGTSNPVRTSSCCTGRLGRGIFPTTGPGTFASPARASSTPPARRAHMRVEIIIVLSTSATKLHFSLPITSISLDICLVTGRGPPVRNIDGSTHPCSSSTFALCSYCSERSLRGSDTRKLLEILAWALAHTWRLCTMLH